MNVRNRVAPAAELPWVHLENSRIVPNRQWILRDVPRGGIIAEVGVAFGDFSRAIMDLAEPHRFYAIDLYNLERHEVAFGVNIREKFAGKSHEEFIRDRFSAEIASGTMVLKKGFSTEVMAKFRNEYFDMIYIDASHDYASVKEDLNVCVQKIKTSGTLVLNDYTMCNPLNNQQYGVVQATHEFCIQQGWKITTLALHRYMFCDVSLRKL